MPTNGRRVLVTGATGYLGRRLISELTAQNYQVSVVVRSTCAPATLETLKQHASAYVHDGTAEGMAQVVREVSPDVIFHLATRFVAQHSTPDIDALVASNIGFGLQLLNAAAKDARPVVNVGTSWQHRDGLPYSPVNLYAASKESLLALSRYFVEAEAPRLLTIELPDVYGPGDHRRKLIDQLCECALEGTELALSSGKALMDPIYVSDAVAAVIEAGELAQKDPAGAIHSVTSGHPISVREVVATFQAAIGRELNVRWGVRPDRPREMTRSWIVHPVLPTWQPRVSLREGLSRTFASFRLAH